MDTKQKYDFFKKLKLPLKLTFWKKGGLVKQVDCVQEIEVFEECVFLLEYSDMYCVPYDFFDEVKGEECERQD